MSLHHYADIERYSPVNIDQPITYEEKSQTQSFHKILAECIEQVKLISALITTDDNSSTDEQEPQRSKRSFLVVSSDGSEGLGSTDENLQ